MNLAVKSPSNKVINNKLTYPSVASPSLDAAPSFSSSLVSLLLSFLHETRTILAKIWQVIAQILNRQKYQNTF